MTHSPRGVRRRRAADSPDTLVAVLNSDGDRHFFLKEHAYRIPDRVLGRALAREILCEGEVARSKVELAKFKKYRDFQKFEIKDEKTGKWKSKS